MKAWLIGFSLLAFIFSHTVFTYYLVSIHMEPGTKNLWRAYSYTFILAAVYIFQKSGLKTFLQSQLIEVTFFVVIFTFVITILTNNLLILNPYHLMGIVDSGTAMATIMILISAHRHGFTKK